MSSVPDLDIGIPISDRRKHALGCAHLRNQTIVFLARGTLIYSPGRGEWGLVVDPTAERPEIEWAYEDDGFAFVRWSKGHSTWVWAAGWVAETGDTR